MFDTLPRAITRELKAFCATIGSGEPVFVDSRPAPGSQTSACFDNVQSYIDTHGGRVEHGWAIWHLRGVYFEAEHHGVWRHPTGKFLDVSPQLNACERILFLPDPETLYDPTNFRSNRLQAEPGSAGGPAVVELARRRYEVLDSYRAGGARAARLSPAHQFELAQIDWQLQALLGS